MTIKDIGERRVHGIEVDLTGPDGNAHYLLGMAGRLAQQLGMNGDKIRAEMQCGDYEKLVKIFDQYFGRFVTLYR